MKMDIDEIRKLITEQSIIWGKHILSRMQQRGIKINDVLKCILTGEIIEEYPWDYPYPSCLICGYINENKALHIVCAIGDNKVWMITAYYPTIEDWHEDWKHRREN